MSVRERGLQSGDIIETLAELSSQHPEWKPADGRVVLTRLERGRIYTDQEIAARVIQTNKDSARFFGLQTQPVDPNAFFSPDSSFFAHLSEQPAGTQFPLKKDGQ